MTDDGAGRSSRKRHSPVALPERRRHGSRGCSSPPWPDPVAGATSSRPSSTAPGWGL